VLEGPLRALAVAASAIVVLSFALFAIDETRAASQRSSAALSGRSAARVPDPSPAQERARERAHGTVRELVDDANDVLVSPFAAASPDGRDKWARRGVPATLAVLVYGLGLSFLARFSRGRA
jgi:hypothetical protein